MQQGQNTGLQEKVNQEGYRRTQMQRDMVIQKLKERGCRITKQRLMLLDIILSEGCSSCKEIYYKAAEKDAGIGTATVYRMVNTLEEIGAISRRNMYRILYDKENAGEDSACMIEFENGAKVYLSEQRWHQILQAGLSACGYEIMGQIRSIMIT